jgi:hypothetical protein
MSTSAVKSRASSTIARLPCSHFSSMRPAPWTLGWQPIRNHAYPWFLCSSILQDCLIVLAEPGSDRLTIRPQGAPEPVEWFRYSPGSPSILRPLQPTPASNNWSFCRTPVGSDIYGGFHALILATSLPSIKSFLEPALGALMSFLG